MLKKKYKLNKLQKIKQTSKYIYFFRYNDLKILDLISLKKNLKQLNYKIIVLNKKLINFIFPKLKGQGSVLIIYGNNNLIFLQNLIIFKKIKLIYLIVQDNIYSYIKIKKLLTQNDLFLNHLIFKPFLDFICFLKKIKKKGDYNLKVEC